MRHWKVRVKSYRMVEGELECHRRLLLLQAQNMDEARQAGRSHAEATATFGADWREFEVTEVSSVDLPIDLTP